MKTRKTPQLQTLSTIFLPHDCPTHHDWERNVVPIYDDYLDSLMAPIQEIEYITENLERIIRAAVVAVSYKTPILHMVMDGYNLSEIGDYLQRTPGAIHHRLYKVKGLVNYLKEAIALFLLIDPDALEDAVNNGFFDIAIGGLKLCGNNIVGVYTGRVYIGNITPEIWGDIMDGCTIPEAVAKYR